VLFYKLKHTLCSTFTVITNHSFFFGQEDVHDLKPDYFHYFSNGKIRLALHGEYDEREGHEDDDERLTAIADAIGCGSENTYIFRIKGWHGSQRELCKRYVVNKNHVYFKLTDESRRVAEQTIAIIKQRLLWIAQGLEPCDAQGRLRKVYINF
jgi:hypothetical protein